MSAPGWLTIREAARRLGLHENTVRNMAGDGRIKARTRPGTRYREISEAAVAALGGAPAVAPSYHDLHITTAGIPRSSLFDLPYSVEVTCTRAGGWRVWRHPEDAVGRAEPVQLAGEYDDPDGWLVLDVAGHVIVDSRRSGGDDG